MRISPRSEESPLGGQLEGQDRAQERPGERDIRTGAEGAEYGSGSDARKGERLLLGNVSKMTFLTDMIKKRDRKRKKYSPYSSNRSKIGHADGCKRL